MFLLIVSAVGANTGKINMKFGIFRNFFFGIPKFISSRFPFFETQTSKQHNVSDVLLRGGTTDTLQAEKGKKRK